MYHEFTKKVGPASLQCMEYRRHFSFPARFLYAKPSAAIWQRLKVVS